MTQVYAGNCFLSLIGELNFFFEADEMFYEQCFLFVSSVYRFSRNGKECEIIRFSREKKVSTLCDIFLQQRPVLWAEVLLWRHRLPPSVKQPALQLGSDWRFSIPLKPNDRLQEFLFGSHQTSDVSVCIQEELGYGKTVTRWRESRMNVSVLGHLNA